MVQRSKRVSVIFVLLGILIIGLLIYLNFFTTQFLERRSKYPVTVPSKTNTFSSGLEMYTNSSIGISFRYPSDWKVVSGNVIPQANGSIAMPLVGLDPKERVQGSSPIPLIQVVFWPNPGNLPISEYQKRYGKEFGFGACVPSQCNGIIVTSLKNNFLEFKSILVSDAKTYAPLEKKILQQVVSSLQYNK